MKNRGIVAVIGLLSATIGLLMVALFSDPAGAGNPAQPVGVVSTQTVAGFQIADGQVLLDIGSQLGWATVYTEALHKTTQVQLDIAQKLTELADELAARGDLNGAAEFALMATELEQRIALKFKSAAGITETYTRSLTQQRSVTQGFAEEFQANYDSSKSESGPTPLFQKNWNSSKNNTSTVVGKELVPTLVPSAVSPFAQKKTTPTPDNR